MVSKLVRTWRTIISCQSTNEVLEWRATCTQAHQNVEATKSYCEGEVERLNTRETAGLASSIRTSLTQVQLSEPILEMSSSAGAVIELEYLLANPPPHIRQTLVGQAGNNPVAVAHAVLEGIREAGDDRCLFLRSILELIVVHHDVHIPMDGTVTKTIQSGKEELFFHCMTGWRQVVLWQWKSYSAVFRRAMRDFFMASGHALGQSSLGSAALRTCRLACYTTCAAFWKRGWAEEEGDSLETGSISPMEESLLNGMRTALPHFLVLQDRADFFRYLEALFSTQPEQAAILTQILVGEVSGKSAVSYRLPLEFHKESHRSFEKNALLPILQCSMRALSQVVANLSQSDQVNGTAATLLLQAQAIVDLTIDVIGWEFGTAAWDYGAPSTARILLRPPHEWKPILAQPDLIRALLEVHRVLVSSGSVASLDAPKHKLSRSFRQLLLQLASLSGPMFDTPADKVQFASILTEGTLRLLEWCNQSWSDMAERPNLLDTVQLVSRLISNFRLTALIELPATEAMLQGLAHVGTRILLDQVRECERAGGDAEEMDHREWREEVVSLILDCSVVLSGDPWLLYSGSEESRQQAKLSLSKILGPLYEGFVRCRTKMAAMEEHRLVTENSTFDEVTEDIEQSDLEEEIGLVSVVGRLDLSASILCLSKLFGEAIPSLQSLWGGSGEITPQAAAVLEEARLLTMYVCQLLTDDNKGEAPAIPDAVLIACQENASLISNVASAVKALLNLADFQMRMIASNTTNRGLSPMLAKSFLWFLDRWAPAYIYPTDYGVSGSTNPITQEWASPDKARQIVAFCIELCLSYQCYWPHEPHVQKAAELLLMSLARRKGDIRSVMVATPMFQEMTRLVCLTGSIRHSASQHEFETIIQSKAGLKAVNIDLAWGFQRLPYQDKAHILASILVACSDPNDNLSVSLLSDTLKAIHESFTSYIHAISAKQIGPDDLNAKEMACLCVELFRGVVDAGEMSDSYRIPQFMTPYLSHLASLMSFYADDLTIGEALLRLFRDYATNFIVTLDREQSLVLFNATADLLKNYSSNHCQKRVIRKLSTTEAEAEEDQEYSDILCAIQLLINLSAKDFIDACSAQDSVNTSQVTDMIFFGLQQILPLMTQGLLQYPTLCQQFFELVGFMMDTYPDKVCALPFELFQSLLESLLFGMSHHSLSVANCSLHGIASIAKEHMEHQSLSHHLTCRPDLFAGMTRRLLSEVIFQSVVVDRVEAAGMALLPLAAVDVNKFSAVVQDLSAQVPHDEHRRRLQAAFVKLIRPEALAKVSEGGYEGRMNRARFKKDFEEFVHEVHAFLVLR